MFSGIIEEAAVIRKLDNDKGNLHLTLECSFTNELKIDQSVAHNGVCLTVVKIAGNCYTVTAIRETLEKSNLGDGTFWQIDRLSFRITINRSTTLVGIIQFLHSEEIL